MEVTEILLFLQVWLVRTVVITCLLSAKIVDLLTRQHHTWFDEADKRTQVLREKKGSCHNKLLAHKT